MLYAVRVKKAEKISARSGTAVTTILGVQRKQKCGLFPPIERRRQYDKNTMKTISFPRVSELGMIPRRGRSEVEVFSLSE